MPEDLDFTRADQVDLRIAGYVLAGIDDIGDAVDLSCAMDEGNVSSMSFKTTFFATSSNIGVLACPSALLGADPNPSQPS